jgi:hypothetical protein
MKKITVTLLKNHDACDDQVALFKKIFPRGVVPTEALCDKHANRFTWWWAQHLLLSARAQGAWEKAQLKARKDYNRACARAFARGWKMDNT